MTARPPIISEASWKLESSWCENLATLDYRVQPLGPVDISGLTRGRMSLNPAVQYQDEDDFFRRGPFGGQFTLELELGGHGATGAGAITATELALLLGYCVGNCDESAVGGGMQGAGTNTTTHLDTAGCTFAAQQLIRVGAKNDGRADGQWSLVTAFTDNGADEDVTLGIATPAASNQTDSAFGAIHVYPNHDGTVSSLRFLLSTANYRVWCRGCFCTAIEFPNINPGEHPRVRLTFGVSQWEFENSTTYPSLTATDAKVGAAVTAAGCFIQAKGTSTRNIENVREFGLAINMDVTPQKGSNGVFEFQEIVGAVRKSCHATIDMTVDALSPGDGPIYHTWANTAEDTIVAKHLLYAMSTADKRSLAFYFPDVIPTNDPTQEDVDGLNRVRVSMKARTNNITTNDLTLSNWRLAMG